MATPVDATDCYRRHHHHHHERARDASADSPGDSRPHLAAFFTENLRSVGVRRWLVCCSLRAPGSTHTNQRRTRIPLPNGRLVQPWGARRHHLGSVARVAADGVGRREVASGADAHRDWDRSAARRGRRTVRPVDVQRSRSPQRAVAGDAGGDPRRRRGMAGGRCRARDRHRGGRRPGVRRRRRHLRVRRPPHRARGPRRL